MKRYILFLLILGMVFGITFCSRQTAGTSRVAVEAETEAPVEEPEAAIFEWPPGIGEVEVELETDVLKKNYYVIFDGSGSMRGDKINAARKAFKEFVSYVPEDANLGLLVFDTSGLSERASLGSSRKKILAEIDKVIANKGTPLGVSAQYGYQMLTVQGLRQLGYGEYNLVIVTDGEASDLKVLESVVDQILLESPVIIHTIGFQIKGGHSLNQPGRIYYRSAENFEELRKGFEEVLAEAEEFNVDAFQQK